MPRGGRPHSGAPACRRPPPHRGRPPAPPVPRPQSLVGSDNFTHILRVLNTNVDGKQKIMYALTAIKGIGRRFSNICCKKAEVDLSKRCAGDSFAGSSTRLCACCACFAVAQPAAVCGATAVAALRILLRRRRCCGRVLRRGSMRLGRQLRRTHRVRQPQLWRHGDSGAAQH